MGILIYCEVYFSVYVELELVQIKVGISFQYDMFPKEISTLFSGSNTCLEFIWHFLWICLLSGTNGLRPVTHYIKDLI